MLPPARIFWLVPLLLGGPLSASDFQLWSNAAVQGSLAGDLLFTADTSIRHVDKATRLGQVVVRGGLGWRLSSQLTLWGGYVHVTTRLRDRDRLVEHRAWQQASYPLFTRPEIAVAGRTRLEQRWLEARDGASWRLRQQLRVAVPLGSDPTAPSLVATHELFWNLESGGLAQFREGADQHRTVIGMVVPLSRQLRVEPSWLRQRLEVPNPDRVNDIIQLSLSVAL